MDKILQVLRGIGERIVAQAVLVRVIGASMAQLLAWGKDRAIKRAYDI
jgi:hypothetical protein